MCDDQPKAPVCFRRVNANIFAVSKLEVGHTRERALHWSPSGCRFYWLAKLGDWLDHRPIIEKSQATYGLHPSRRIGLFSQAAFRERSPYLSGLEPHSGCHGAFQVPYSYHVIVPCHRDERAFRQAWEGKPLSTDVLMTSKGRDRLRKFILATLLLRTVPYVSQIMHLSVAGVWTNETIGVDGRYLGQWSFCTMSAKSSSISHFPDPATRSWWLSEMYLRWYTEPGLEKQTEASPFYGNV